MQSHPVSQFDVWRGIALTGLTFNHLLLWPCVNLSFALRLTYQSVGWVSFATVFFVIAGIQWGRRIERERTLWHWNLRRAGRLLLWVAVATGIFIILSHWGILGPAPWQKHIAWAQPATVFWAVTGLRLPWLIDVIWLHGWLGIFATILWSLPILRVSSGRIAAVSLIVWSLAQAGVFDLPDSRSNALPWHSWTSWQLLFVGAALSQRGDVQKLIEYFNGRIIRGIMLVILLFFCVAKNSKIGAAIDSAREASGLGPLFAINSAILSLYASKLRFPEGLNFLAGIGKRSLWFYSIQCFLVYLLGSAPATAENEKITSLLMLGFALLSILMMNRLVFDRRSE